MAGYEDGDTPVPQQGHAFISYVREDSGAVDALQCSLEAAGVPVWRDTASLWPGEDWRAKIKEAITRDALVFIACFSSHTAARQKSHFYEELLLAIEQLRLRRPHDLWLIPARFDDCEVPELELGPGRALTSIQQADLFGEKRDLALVPIRNHLQSTRHLPRTVRGLTRIRALAELVPRTRLQGLRRPQWTASGSDTGTRREGPGNSDRS